MNVLRIFKKESKKMKRIINLEYLKKYLSNYFWKLKNSNDLSPDYYNIIFKVELDHALMTMESTLYRESEICEVRDALRYILNSRDFDFIRILKETADIAYSNQKDARDLFLYIWQFLFDESWEYGSDFNKESTIVLKNKLEEKMHVKDIISQTRWCDNRENTFWGDTQLFFNGDGSGVLCYSRSNKKNKILFHFNYKIKENDYTENTIITIDLPDLDMGFEMAIRITKAMKTYYNTPECANTVLKLSDHPFLITQDFLNRRNHFPVETVFYQL
jgi:hypothetical protein